jgi:hypothetical protein
VLVEWKYRAGGRGGGANIVDRADLHYVLVKHVPGRMRFRETVRNNLHVVSTAVVQAWRNR